MAEEMSVSMEVVALCLDVLPESKPSNVVKSDLLVPMVKPVKMESVALCPSAPTQELLPCPCAEQETLVL